MKVNSQQTGTGRLGASVYSVNSGVCITRSYREHITNPNTPAQVAQRARMKLMTQLAAAMAPVIAIPKNGLVSGRNQFISTNFPYSSANEEAANCEFEKLQLTKATLGLPEVHATRETAAGAISVVLKESAALSCDRITYVMFAKNAENKLQYMTSIVVTEAGQDGTFPGTLPACTTDCVIYAYGMKDASAAASAKYGNYSVSSGADIAQLIMSRKLAASDYRLTKTQGVIFYANEEDSDQWHNPFPGATLVANGIEVDPIEEIVAFEDGSIDSVTIEGIPEGHVIVIEELSTQRQEEIGYVGNDTYQNEDIEPVTLTAVILVDGFEWVRFYNE